MPANSQLLFLLASGSPALLSRAEPALVASGAQVKIALSAESALDALTGAPTPSLALLDADLPGMETGQLLASMHAADDERRFPIVLISDTVTQDCLDRLANGAIDDLILRDALVLYWRFRIETVLRAFHAASELDQLRRAGLLKAQTDPLTGIYNRPMLLSMLFRETDRVQRMHTSLSTILFGLDDFDHGVERLGSVSCDDLRVQLVRRVQRLLRSYDLFGRIDDDSFLVVLPGCTSVNAVMLAERIRQEVFSAPFRVGGEVVRVSACFGIAPSHGRSPMVVLREAEQALQLAKASGPESIQCASETSQPQIAPAAFLSSVSGDDPLAW